MCVHTFTNISMKKLFGNDLLPRFSQLPLTMKFHSNYLNCNANIPIHLDLLRCPQVSEHFQEFSTCGSTKGVPPFFLTLKDSHLSPSDHPPISDGRLFGLRSELTTMSIFSAVVPWVSRRRSGGPPSGHHMRPGDLRWERMNHAINEDHLLVTMGHPVGE